MVVVIGVSGIAIALVGAVLYSIFSTTAAGISFFCGAVMTSALNMLKVVMIQRTVDKVVDIDDVGAGKNFSRFQYLLRLLTSGGVLLIAALLATLVPFVDISLLWGAIIGIFTLQVAAVLAKFVGAKEDELN